MSLKDPADGIKVGQRVMFEDRRATNSVEAYRRRSLPEIIHILATGGEAEDPPKSTLEIPRYNAEMSRTESHFRRVAMGSIVCYVFLVWLSYAMVGDECAEPLKAERTAATIAAACIFISLILHLLTIFLHRNGHPPISGVVFAAIVVQGVAMTSNGIMAFGRAPVMIDPVTGARVNLLRWAEFTPLAFLMTFLVEGSDIPSQRWGLVLAYATAATQGLSTFCGFLFPLCPGVISWSLLMTVSFILFGFIFLRLRNKETRFRLVQESKRLDELEIFNRSAISLRLLRTCVVGWSFIVLVYCIFSVMCPLFAPQGSFLANPAIPMIGETFSDVVLKVFYMAIIVNLHEQVFDEGARAKRRLEELRQMMWTNSSDVLAISVNSISGIVTTMVSPTFFKMLREGKTTKQSLQQDADMPCGDRGMIFELPRKDLEALLDCDSTVAKPLVEPKLYDFDFGGFNLQNITQRVHQVSKDVTNLIGDEEMQALAELMARSWHCQNRDTLLSHELVVHGDEQSLETIHCEAKVTRLEESALFVVVRDISERFRRFEAEKKAVSEMTARRKDSEANRFTRHEVKNGLLAALGLSDSLTETMKGAVGSLEKLASAARNDETAEQVAQLCTVQDNVSSIVTELDSAIHEVLETILTEAMARDVINEMYVAELEMVEMVALLESMSRHTKGNAERFPVSASPEPFPALLFDPQLLKCIHRNAISNACKYGKRGGVVTTNLSYSPNSKTLQMDVTNEPGDNHGEILNLGAEGEANVFSPGYRLHSKLGSGDRKSNIGRQSSGDGGWIMQRCAKALGGKCSIEFQEGRTVFSLRCPATLFDSSRSKDDETAAAFKLPRDVWGIALDDSKMQRKLLKRFLLLAGVSEERIIVRGESAKEINTFDDFMFDFVGCHPNDHFLLIVDENLDVEMDDVDLMHSCVSGSLAVQKLRYRLLPEQERQMVAVIRSANDSSHDIAIYKSRAHGFMPKAPIKKDKISAILAPIWHGRYEALDDDRSVTSSVHSAGSATFLSEVTDSNSLVTEHIRKVDELVQDQGGLDSERWPDIWQKLHAFKGDLLSSRESAEVDVIVKIINDMRGRSLPVHFMQKWCEVRDLALKLDLDDDSLSGDE